MLELKLDIPALWRIWEDRAQQLSLVEGSISELKQEISQEVADLIVGSGNSPIVNYSILLDRGMLMSSCQDSG